MKLLISFLLFITMPYIIYCVEPKPFAKEIEQMDKLAKSGTTINGVIRLKKKGFLGRGSYGFVYEGTTSGNNCSVAVKFATEQNEEFIQNEFLIYQYLDAYQNPLVERFGIPMVHHYGNWKKLIFIAISKFEGDLNDVSGEGGLYCPLNVLIFFRNFLIQSKYMHSRGVRHDDIKPGNIMLRGHKTFLIDFNLSAKMAEFKNSCSISYASRRYHQNVLRHAVDDWESFLYSMCHMLGVQLKWFLPEFKNKEYVEKVTLFGEFKNQTQVIRNRIERHIEDEDLKKIFKLFADEVYNKSKTFPNYDDLESLISEKIMDYHDENSSFLPTFTWLSEGDKIKAMENPLPDIKGDISEPSGINFESFNYPNAFQSEAQSSGAAHIDEDDDRHTNLEENVASTTNKISRVICCLFNRKK